MDNELGSPMYPEAFHKAVRGLRNLGVSERVAMRQASALLRGQPQKLAELIEGLHSLRDDIGKCPFCHFMSQGDNACRICSNPKRSPELCCVVASPADLEAVERSGSFNGKYYIMGEVLTPETMDSFKNSVRGLVAELKRRNASEAVLAFKTDVDGENTMSYLNSILTKMNIRVSRPAVGIPVTQEIEFAGSETLRRAMENRQAIPAA